MRLGAFSVSLAVKDINISKEFYEKLGFQQIGGEIEQNWVIMQNENSTIGLFKGMFKNNILTFNPGWDQKGQTLEDYLDVREIQKNLKAQDIEFDAEADDSASGPAHFAITDPDGNAILVDQHV
jgi:catechol 2,3-dioxygenase-like lactoylglutathione lyase family enzyme